MHQTHQRCGLAASTAGRQRPRKEVTITSDELDLRQLVPQILSNPEDGGAYLNYGLVIMKDPDTGLRNLGIYRMLIRCSMLPRKFLGSI
ncbi:MAG: hypothetical protein DRQ54_04825 [Gammaproteobacteria bacterium]|nr:MAG: hypothetical protein DRQ54_04825 [Gammaproteobacteria bacterium]RLA13733.1 MAG: hypothetical protein DRQ52_05665 [Gammaproteobacteria bacterium]